MNCLPMLFKKTSTGATQTWEIMWEGAKLWTRFGQQGGKIQETVPTICLGKNIGRSNETTPEEQAGLEAQAQWEKKLRNSGYVQSLDAAHEGAVDASVQGEVWPMLATKYRDRADKLQWPVAAQRKLNGHRCIAIVDEQGRATLWSRKRQPILSMPHIVKALEALGYPDIRFDGELFDSAFVAQHGLEALSHVVRSSKPVEGHEQIRYHIYDAPLEQTSFRKRLLYRDAILRHRPQPELVAVETLEMPDHDAAMAWLEQMMDEEAAEGIMLRNWAGLYKFHPTGRSDDLQKLKGVGNKYDDAEFKVVGVKQGKKGKMVGKAIFECVTDKGVTFEAKMKGNLDALKEYWEHPERAIGRTLTVQFVGWSKKGKPWFPVALNFRDEL